MCEIWKPSQKSVDLTLKYAKGPLGLVSQWRGKNTFLVTLQLGG